VEQSGSNNDDNMEEEGYYKAQLTFVRVQSPNPRQRFIANLRRDIKTRIRNQEAIILVGDFNERLGDDPNLLASICGEFDLFDVHAYQHGDASMVPTYIRGSKRLDYCLLSPQLAPLVLASGINLFNQC
jgi:endonuclease/exonuclease/phosphatase family metal-dependent hydrolase